MRYQQYKFKFYMDARHAIYIGGKLGEVHPHTWEIVLHVVKERRILNHFIYLKRQLRNFWNLFRIII